MKTHPMVSLHGSYYVNNYGDVLLINIFYGWIKESFPSLTVNLPLVDKVKIKEMPEPTQTGFLNLLKSDCLIYCGGGYFGEPSHRKIKWSIRAFFRHAVIGIIAILFKKPIALLGVEIGPLSINWFRIVVLWIVKHSKVVLVRNQESYDFLLKNKANNVSLAADAVLTLNQQDSPKASIIFEQRIRPYIVLHLPGFRSNPKGVATFIKGLCESLRKAKKTPHLLFIDDATSKYDSEYEPLFQIVNNNEFSYSFQPYTGINSILEIIANASAVFTTKLHIGITAAAYNKKVFSIYAHPKTANFHKQIGNSYYCLPLSRINQYRNLIDIIDSFFEAEEPILSSSVLLLANKNKIELESFIRTAIPIFEKS